MSDELYDEVRGTRGVNGRILEVMKGSEWIRDLAEGAYRGAGGTAVVHVSLTTVTRVRFRPRAVI